MTNPGLSITPDPPMSMSQVPTEVGSPEPPSSPITTDPTDPINNVNCPVHGWPTLAKIIAEKPDLEAFASFTDLNIKSLLYYQAELLTLRKELHRLEWKDNRASDDDSTNYADDLGYLIGDRDASVKSMENKDPEPVPLPQQWKLIEKIRTTLDKYSKLQRFERFFIRNINHD
jgi:hypothetical protein